MLIKKMYMPLNEKKELNRDLLRVLQKSFGHGEAAGRGRVIATSTAIVLWTTTTIKEHQ